MTATSATSSVRASATDQALTVATRLLDPHVIRDTVPGLLGASLSRGLAGTALLHARLAATDPVFEAAAVRHWEQAAEVSAAHGGGIGGIHSGPGALAASMIVGTGYLGAPERHRAAAARGARWLSARASHLADWQRARLAEGGTGTPWHIYDLINGLSGIGRVLLAASVAGHGEAEPGLLAARDTLTAMMLTPDGPRPGWWRPTPENEHAEADSHNPDGANTGLAHGISGPMAFLAACESAGYRDAVTATAIRAAADWLLLWRDGESWPPQITRDNAERGTATMSDRGRRHAWCYGAPGIGRALVAAGGALSDPALAKVGSNAHFALAERPVDEWDAEGPTLCHGHAGVLLCSDDDTGASAARAVTAAYDPRHAFGFQHAEGANRRDEPGLLIGATGVALALADHSNLLVPDVPTRWDAVLLLS